MPKLASGRGVAGSPELVRRRRRRASLRSAGGRRAVLQGRARARAEGPWPAAQSGSRAHAWDGRRRPTGRSLLNGCLDAQSATARRRLRLGLVRARDRAARSAAANCSRASRPNRRNADRRTCTRRRCGASRCQARGPLCAASPTQAREQSSLALASQPDPSGSDRRDAIRALDRVGEIATGAGGAIRRGRQPRAHAQLSLAGALYAAGDDEAAGAALCACGTRKPDPEPSSAPTASLRIRHVDPRRGQAQRRRQPGRSVRRTPSCAIGQLRTTRPHSSHCRASTRERASRRRRNVSPRPCSPAIRRIGTHGVAPWTLPWRRATARAPKP